MISDLHNEGQDNSSENDGEIKILNEQVASLFAQVAFDIVYSIIVSRHNETDYENLLPFRRDELYKGNEKNKSKLLNMSSKNGVWTPLPWESISPHAEIEMENAFKVQMQAYNESIDQLKFFKGILEMALLMQDIRVTALFQVKQKKVKRIR